jgi:biopolymer transport protein ExbB
MLLADFSSEFAASIDAVWRFVSQGGVFMLCLLTLSVLSVSVIVLKALVLRSEQVVPQQAQLALAEADAFLGVGEQARLAGELRAAPSPLSRIGMSAMAGDHPDRAEASIAVEANAREEVVKLEAGIALLEVIITIAPLLGLLGTVSGLVGVFTNLDMKGGADTNTAVARGIAEALYTTIAGMAVAIPTVIAHSYFTKKLERMGVRMEVLVGGLLSALYRGKLSPGGAPAEEAGQPVARPFYEGHQPPPTV